MPGLVFTKRVNVLLNDFPHSQSREADVEMFSVSWNLTGDRQQAKSTYHGSWADVRAEHRTCDWSQAPRRWKVNDKHA